MKKPFYLLTLFTLLLAACGSPNNESTLDSESNSSEESIYVDPRPEEFLSNDLYQEIIHSLGEYTPTLFDETSLDVTLNEELSEGVALINYSFNLKSGKKVKASTVEVDLSKADIRTNYSVGASQTLYSQMTSFENQNEGIDVIAGINADFFARGGTSVNAYIKDYQIIKAGHNDKGIYDYKNLDADIPASMPMLLGTGKGHARIAPIVENESVENTIKSKFHLKIKYAGEDKVVHDLSGNLELNLKNGVNKPTADYTFVNQPVNLGVNPGIGDICYVIEMEEGQYTINHGKVIERWECDGNRVYTDDTVDGYAYLFMKNGLEEVINVGDYVGYVIGNDDSKFDGYQNIIGGRQSLIENGNIAPTLSLENSNGAQATGVPRSSVGIKDDGKLVIVAVEGLRYGGTSSSSEDGYGVSLPELAQFMREINCYDAMNFDGGGSTSLITRNLNTNLDYQVTVRSSDYGTYSLNQSRQVYNCLIITSKD